MDFGAIALAETSWRTLQVRNTGDTDVLITRLTSSNTFVFQVEPAFSVPYLLGPGQAQNVNLGFSPYELIEYDALLDIDADIEGGGILVPLSGSGGTPRAPSVPRSFRSRPHQAAATDCLSPPSGMGCTANGAVVVSNSGDMPLIVSEVSLNNDNISTCGSSSTPGPARRRSHRREHHHRCGLHRDLRMHGVELSGYGSEHAPHPEQRHRHARQGHQSRCDNPILRRLILLSLPCRGTSRGL